MGLKIAGYYEKKKTYLAKGWILFQSTKSSIFLGQTFPKKYNNFCPEIYSESRSLVLV